jgi:type IV pilus assembly protein PilM
VLGFVQNIFGNRVQPIGVDFGSDCLRLAQVQHCGSRYKLIAAAAVDVPPEIRHEPQGRLQFFAQQAPQLLAAAPFRGRQAVLGLPAASMHIRHLRLDRMSDQALKEAIPEQTFGKLPLDPAGTLLRHYIAGEIRGEQDAKLEVIVMAAARQWIDQFLAAALAARLEIIAMNVEPLALVDCFSHIYRRKSDWHMTQCLVDIGSSGTRATIWRSGQMLFARGLSIGGDHLTRATASALSIGFEDARTLRIKLAATSPPPIYTPTEQNPDSALSLARRASDRFDSPVDRNDSLAPPSCVTTAALAQQARLVQLACHDTVTELAGDLDACRRDHESTFPTSTVDRLIFVGGEARQRQVCRQIANQLGLFAQLGDPMCRMIPSAQSECEIPIDPRTPQPAWAVAIGLSMGAHHRAAIAAA